jgi:hypothetical protein
MEVMVACPLFYFLGKDTVGVHRQLFVCHLREG